METTYRYVPYNTIRMTRHSLGRSSTPLISIIISTTRRAQTPSDASTMGKVSTRHFGLPKPPSFWLRELFLLRTKTCSEFRPRVCYLASYTCRERCNYKYKIYYTAASFIERTLTLVVIRIISPFETWPSILTVLRTGVSIPHEDRTQLQAVVYDTWCKIHAKYDIPGMYYIHVAYEGNGTR